MDKKLIYGLIILFLLIPYSNADIIAISSGGNDHLLINPDNYISNIFFGDVDEVGAVSGNVTGVGGSTNPILDKIPPKIKKPIIIIGYFFLFIVSLLFFLLFLLILIGSRRRQQIYYFMKQKGLLPAKKKEEFEVELKK